ncbi:sporulation protein [Paenibacillus sedimenti]|uniref:Sporulation protein n=1 Tax=Paenibacillus sedimenti TaxID=2770274 RepID=A0A926KV15_9BACL|nr:sporulation protein [Paenibacillus sedimenti]MBD0382505.1 sporulation protein [Paenibacillus sedimenti]
MSIYKRMMDRAANGGVQIDTFLDEPSGVRCGEELRGSVILKGGHSETQVTRIWFQLLAEFACEKDKQIVKENGVIYRYMFETNISIAPGEEKNIPFRFQIPFSTPLSIGTTNIWLETEADVEMAPNRNDRDVVRIMPPPIVGAFFEAVGLLGLRLNEVSLLHVPHLRPDFPFVQEFEFKPRLPSALDEIEVYYIAESRDRVDFYIEIDRRSKGMLGLLEEAFDWDERCIKVTLTSEDIGDPDRLADHLARTFLPYLGR